MELTPREILKRNLTAFSLGINDSELVKAVTSYLPEGGWTDTAVDALISGPAGDLPFGVTVDHLHKLIEQKPLPEGISSEARAAVLDDRHALQNDLQSLFTQQQEPELSEGVAQLLEMLTSVFGEGKVELIHLP